MKTLNSNKSYYALELTFCHILFIVEGLGKHIDREPPHLKKKKWAGLGKHICREPPHLYK